MSAPISQLRVDLMLQLNRRRLGATTQGQTLAEISEALAMPDQKGKVVTVLRRLVRCDHADYVPAANSYEKRTKGGTYLLTDAGRAWLHTHGYLGGVDDAPDDDEAPIETGAMRSEAGEVIQARAEAGQAPAGAIASIFDLGRRFAEASA